MGSPRTEFGKLVHPCELEKLRPLVHHVFKRFQNAAAELALAPDRNDIGVWQSRFRIRLEAYPTLQIDQIEAQIYRLGKAEISSQVIGDMVMERLRELDELAYILFASVYLPLTDLESMKKEVDRLLQRRG